MHELINYSYQTFYNNLQALHNEHDYSIDHIWNSNKIGIHVNKHVGAKVLINQHL
jgi:hypothetical protein